MLKILKKLIVLDYISNLHVILPASYDCLVDGWVEGGGGVDNKNLPHASSLY